MWLLNHLMSGTWLWAVIAAGAVCQWMHHSQRSAWHRYGEAFALCLSFLSSTTIAWYGSVTPFSQLPLLAIVSPALCAMPTAGIAVVAAFGGRPETLGLLARLCMPMGLALILLVTPPPLEYGGNAAAQTFVWRVLMAANLGLAALFLTHFLLARREKESPFPSQQ